MKIKLIARGGFEGLARVEIPVEVDAEFHGDYYIVPYSEMEKLKNFRWVECDAEYGSGYIFLEWEIEIK